jgi:hypothetical protein
MWESQDESMRLVGGCEQARGHNALAYLTSTLPIEHCNIIVWHHYLLRGSLCAWIGSCVGQCSRMLADKVVRPIANK